MIPRYPLQWPAGWPRSTSRKRAQFSTRRNSAPIMGGNFKPAKSLSVADGTERVLRELGMLRISGDDVVISTNVALRLDGLPRSGQGEPSDPGVAVYWVTRKGKQKVMAVDIYDRVADNLAAIAATLEAMRAIERHGGGQVLERAFTGFDALPPPRSCWQILGLAPGASRDAIEAAYRTLAKKHHPDAGGTDNEFVAITAARDEALRT
jgi:hypothetical protein